MGRIDKVASVLKHEISNILLRDITDKRIRLISITEVTVTPDLKHAIVYYSPFGKDVDRKEVQKGLASATKFIQREIFKKLTMKIIPQIHFKFDETLERGFELVEKIGKLDVQSDSDATKTTDTL